MIKSCSVCKLEKDNSQFSASQLARGNRRRCRGCVKLDKASYTMNNPEKVKLSRQIWHQKNKEAKNEDSRNWAKNNKTKRNAQLKEKYNSDPIFRLRDRVSSSVRSALKHNGGSKNGSSILDCLPYSISELKWYIQNQFEFWMTWDNQGIYNIGTWNDNDSSTWTWHIDHIIPQSDLPYTSMDDDNFKKCWALSNLRPFSAKQNVLKSNKKIAA